MGGRVGFDALDDTPHFLEPRARDKGEGEGEEGVSTREHVLVCGAVGCLCVRNEGETAEATIVSAAALSRWGHMSMTAPVRPLYFTANSTPHSLHHLACMLTRRYWAPAILGGRPNGLHFSLRVPHHPTQCFHQPPHLQTIQQPQSSWHHPTPQLRSGRKRTCLASVQPGWSFRPRSWSWKKRDAFPTPLRRAPRRFLATNPPFSALPSLPARFQLWRRRKKYQSFQQQHQPHRPPMYHHHCR